MAHPRSTQDPAGAFGGLGRAKTTLPDGPVVLIGGERELPRRPPIAVDVGKALLVRRFDHV